MAAAAAAAAPLVGALDRFGVGVLLWLKAGRHAPADAAAGFVLLWSILWFMVCSAASILESTAGSRRGKGFKPAGVARSMTGSSSFILIVAKKNSCSVESVSATIWRSSNHSLSQPLNLAFASCFAPTHARCTCRFDTADWRRNLADSRSICCCCIFPTNASAAHAQLGRHEQGHHRPHRGQPGGRQAVSLLNRLLTADCLPQDLMHTPRRPLTACSDPLCLLSRFHGHSRPGRGAPQQAAQGGVVGGACTGWRG